MTKEKPSLNPQDWLKSYRQAIDEEKVAPRYSLSEEARVRISKAVEQVSLDT